MIAWNTASEALKTAKPTFDTACAKDERAAVIDTVMVKEYVSKLPSSTRTFYMASSGAKFTPQRSRMRDVNVSLYHNEANIHYRQDITDTHRLIRIVHNKRRQFRHI